MLRALVIIVACTVAAPAWANDATPDHMQDECRKEMARQTGAPAGLINVRYEGQRTDGTHAVNGDAEGPTPFTFQCSFGPRGWKIRDMVVNDICPPDVSEANRYMFPACG